MAHCGTQFVRYIVSCNAIDDAVRFLHLFKFGLVVLGGATLRDSRQSKDSLLFFLPLLKLLSACGGVAELSACSVAMVYCVAIGQNYSIVTMCE